MAAVTHNSTSPQLPNGSSHPYTCNTCQVAFRSSDLQRTHMQSDWHRYNLKRRVASLPPLTSEIFAEKVLANKASAAATAARASFEKHCSACGKTYYSENAYQNHLGSQKHRAHVARLRSAAGEGAETDSVMSSTFSLGEPIDTASTTSVADTEVEEEFSKVVDNMKQSSLDEPSEPLTRRPARPHRSAAEGRQEHPLSATSTVTSTAGTSEDAVEDDDAEHVANLKQCLFCYYASPSLDLNITHMGRQHGFFIPERDYLVDLPGLIAYLSETIAVLHQCLYCGHTKHTASGVQTHMRDRGHCMIAYGTEEEQMEIGDFYDFRSTYSDASSTVEDDDAEHDGGVLLGAKRNVKTTIQNENGEDTEMTGNEEDGWESDSTLSSIPTDEITSVPIEHEHKYKNLDKHRHHSHSDPRPHKNLDGFHSHAHTTPHAVYHDDYELHLPGGRIAGHRSLRAYYRQNLHNYPSAEERVQQRVIEAAQSSDDENEHVQQQNGRGRQIISRADGGLGMVGVSDAKKRQVKAVEKRDQKKQQRAQARYNWGNEKRANFQKHFRDPLLQ